MKVYTNIPLMANNTLEHSLLIGRADVVVDCVGVVAHASKIVTAIQRKEKR